MTALILFWISLSSLLSLLVSLALGSLHPITAILSLLIAGLAGIWLQKENIKNTLSEIDFKNQYLRNLCFVILFLALSFQFTYLLYEIRLDELWLATINPNNRGDLPFHINMIKAFTRGLHFWPDHLFLIGERLRYPFGMNLFNAQLEILGIPLSVHLMLTGLLCLGLLISELYQWMGIWGLICFFFSGGLGSYLPGEDLAFKNLYLSVFVTQRGFLWALPAGIWLIRNFAGASKKHNYLWIFIFSIMPFFHLHSFFFLFIYFAGQRFSKSLAWVLLLASPWILQAVWGNQAQQVIHFSSYWLKFNNFGAWGVFALVSFVLAFKRKELMRNDIWIYSLAVLFSILILAPWDWDQIKILIWCYLLVNSVIAQRILPKLSRHWFEIIMVLVFYPGIMQMWNSLPARQFRKDRVYLAKISDIQKIQKNLEKINPADVVLAAPVYNHPLFFAGQSVVVGYPGHMWSQAVQAGPALDFIQAAVAAGKVPETQAFKAPVVWILSSPFEKEKWPASQLFSEPDWSLSCVKPGHCQ